MSVVICILEEFEMGLFDESAAFLEELVKKERYTEEEKQSFKDFAKKSPVYGKNLEKAWQGIISKHDSAKLGRGEEKLSSEEYKSLYKVLKESKLGKINSFEELLTGVKKDIDQNIVTKEDLDKWGKELDIFSPRVPGTKAMDDANDYIEKEFKNFGIETWKEPIDFRGVFFHDWSLDIETPEKLHITSFPENNVGFGDVTAEIVYVGKGEEANYEGKDVKGKIVLTNWGVLWDHEGACALRERYTLLHLYDVAYAHGAAGIIGYFEDTPGNTIKLLEPGIKPTGGSNIWGPGEIGPERQFKVPALNIGREDALQIKELLNKGKVTAHLKIDGVRKVSTTNIVAGVLPGKSAEVVAVAAHSCTAFEGAVCDTIGVVTALAIAKYYSSQPVEKREKTLLFFFDSYHVWGNCNQTSLTLLDRHKELTDRVQTLLWLDHLSDGKPDTPRAVTVSNHPIVWPVITLLQAKFGIAPSTSPISRIWSVCVSGAFERIGVPVSTVQTLNEETLTPEDNWNKFDLDTVFKDVQFHINLAESLAAFDIKRNEPGEPAGGCGALFTNPANAKYEDGESYKAEPEYPLYVGGATEPIRILKTREEKRKFIFGE